MDVNAHKRQRTEIDSQDIFSASYLKSEDKKNTESHFFRQCVDNFFLVEPIDVNHGLYATKMVNNLENFEKVLQKFIHHGFEQSDLYQSICTKCQSLCKVESGGSDHEGPFKQMEHRVKFLKIMAKMAFYLVKDFEASELQADSRCRLMMIFSVIHSCMKSFNTDKSILFEESIMEGQILGLVELTSHILRLISDVVQDESVVYSGLRVLSEIVKNQEDLHKILENTFLRCYISTVKDTFKCVVHIIEIATCIQASLSIFDKSEQGLADILAKQSDEKTELEKCWDNL